MTINWGALGLVAGVTLVATVIVVSLVATAAKLLDAGHVRQQAGQATGFTLVGAWALLGIVGLIVLFGLWLVIPYFH
ncbi:MAG: hypothetical protein FWF36_03990 [Propionibacteriaceae bacterium]|nr:hypothetical protein [Propionibacteriaceae bacterium]